MRDRDCIRFIHFREPRGTLFRVATPSPGFAAGEDPDPLGVQLRVPATHAHLREQAGRTVIALENPRAAGARG